MNDTWAASAAPALYLVSACAFILGLKALARARTASRGVRLLAAGFGLASSGALLETEVLGAGASLLGLVLGAGAGWCIGRAKAESWGFLAPGAGGLAAALLALAAFASDDGLRGAGRLGLGGGPRGAVLGLAAIAGVVALALGLRAAVGRPARGRSRPAVLALAASASGLASAMVGLALGNAIVVTVGGLIASAGYALAALIGAGLGHPAIALGLGSARPSGGKESGRAAYAEVRTCAAEEAAMVLETARRVVLIPGRGMAMAQAQHALADVLKLLVGRRTAVVCALHPAAGVIPGHMNILLDEAKVPAEHLLEWEAANDELAAADVALVVGANDIVNPGARDDPGSAVYGMPLLEAGRARTVFVIKRTLGPGAAGVRNPLFERPNVSLILGDARQVLQTIAAELKQQVKAAA